VRRIGTAQRGKRLVTQMRGRAAAIGRSANRCRNRAITGSGAYSSETRSTQTSIQHNQISRLGNGSPCSRPSAPSPAAGYRVSDHRFEARGNPVVRQ